MVSFLFTVLITIVAQAQDVTPACPHTLDEWLQWRQDSIERHLDMTNPEGFTNLVGIRSHDLSADITRRCGHPDIPVEILADPRWSVCWDRMLRYGTGYHYRASTLPDAPTSPPEVPAVLQDSAFITALHSARTPAEVVQSVALISARLPAGSRGLYYTTDMGTPDRAGEYGRAVFMIPGAEADIFTQFDLLPPARMDGTTSSAGTTISVVEVRHHSASGAPLTPLQSRLVDRYTPAFSHFVPPGHAGSISCVTCHSNQGPHAIYSHDAPTDRVLFAPTGETPAAVAAAINSRISSYGRMSMLGLDEEALSPPWGQARATWRSNEFMRQCGARWLSAASRNRVRRAMNCTNCHNGTDRAPILDSMAADRGVRLRHMPPGSELTPQEQSALVECLSYEQYTAFSASPRYAWARRFLTPPGCAPAAPASTTARGGSEALPAAATSAEE